MKILLLCQQSIQSKQIYSTSQPGFGMHAYKYISTKNFLLPRDYQWINQKYSVSSLQKQVIQILFFSMDDILFGNNSLVNKLRNLPSFNSMQKFVIKFEASHLVLKLVLLLQKLLIKKMLELKNFMIFLTHYEQCVKNNLFMNYIIDSKYLLILCYLTNLFVRFCFICNIKQNQQNKINKLRKKY
eukprot:TRINITY_DN1900_c0_g1_i2.p3 TRINITY_DN1900_c0_g1~~TRINITY_DN1900_c0_g1_i2.p3  ORF type:complete len:185 (+),score=-13.38 TRINITY_DN1900_c0_g1_i2:233-787(+)